MTLYPNLTTERISMLDINGDDIEDIFLDGLGWIPRNADGTLEALVEIPALINFQGLMDFDNDGLVDWVDPENLGSQTLRWHKNMGAAGFAEMQGIYFDFEEIKNKLFADVDNDGLIDVIVIGKLESALNNSLYWVKHGSNQEFEHVVEIDNNPVFGNIFGGIEQIDSDNFIFLIQGDPDVLAINVETSTQNFTVIQPKALTGFHPHLSKVVYFDFNLDQEKDLIFEHNGELELYENKGNWQFEFQSTISTGWGNGYKFSHLIDIDGGGHPEFLLRNGRYLEPVLNGLPEAILRLPELVQVDSDADVELQFPYDLNNDDKIDLIFSHNSGISFQKSFFEQLRDTKIWQYAGRVQDYSILKDLDHNGSMELVGIKGAELFIIDFSAHGPDYRFAETFFTYSEDDLAYFSNIVSIDLDQDGDDDLICEEGVGDFGFIFINDGSNNFSAPSIYNRIRTDVQNYSDLNGDGILDIVSSKATSNSNNLYTWLSKNGQVDYELTITNLPANYRMSTSTLVDLNNDNVSELLFVDNSNHSYSAMYFVGGEFDVENLQFLFEIESHQNNYCLFKKNVSTQKIEAFRKVNGRPIDYIVYDEVEEKFDTVAQVNLNSERPLAIYDVDADGDFDLYIYDEVAKVGRLAINDNTEFNLIPTSFNFPFGDFHLKVIVDDLNGDGRMDYHNIFGEFAIAKSANPTDFIEISFNNSGMRESNYLDLDLDGDLDNISIINNEISIRENFGDFAYSHIQTLFKVPTNYYSQDKHLPAFYDFNKDGLLDFIAPFTDGVSKFINTSNSDGISFDSTILQDRRKDLVYFYTQELEKADVDLMFGLNEENNQIEVYSFVENTQDFVFESILNVPAVFDDLQINEIYNFDVDYDGLEEIIINVRNLFGGPYSTLIIDSDWSDLNNLNAEFLVDEDYYLDAIKFKDFDDDGNVDILASQYSSLNLSNIVWSWNGPDFSDFPLNPKLVHIGWSLTNSEILDFDRDGDLDFVGDKAWVEQRENNFSRVKEIPFIERPLFAKNIDDDDLIEFFYPNYVYRYDVEKNQLLQPINQNLYTRAQELSDINTIDWNKDGKGDFLMTYDEYGDFEKSNTLSYLHKGTSEKWDHFGSQEEDGLDMIADELITSYDFNNDGTNDILHLRYANLSVKLSNSIGSFDVPSRICGCGNQPLYRQNVHVGDVDMDGDLDLVYVGNPIFLFENKLDEGQGIFEIQSFSTLPQYFNFQLKEASSGAGFDLLFMASENGNIALYKYSNISFSNGIGPRIKLTDLEAGGLFIDADGDGDLDIINGPTETGDFYQIRIFYNDGDYNFSEVESIIEYVFDLEDRAWVDVTGDGAIDLIMLNEFAQWAIDGLGIYPSLPDRKFGSYISIEKPENHSGKIITRDLDNDQDLDFAIHTNTGVYIYENKSESIKLTLESFIDNNQNGIRDAGEFALNNCNYRLMPSSIFQFPNSLGQTVYSVNQGTYEVTGSAPPLWTPTSNSNTFSVQIEDNDTIVQIGYYPTSEFRDLDLHVVAARQRCNADAPLWFCIQNNGSSVENITNVVLKYDNKVTPIRAIPEFLSDAGDSLWWEANMILYPQEKLSYYLEFEMPDETFTGEFNSYELFIESEQVGIKLTDSYKVTDAEVRCSYDPNDKLVSPNRSNLGWDVNETLFEETLNYTIRFQNTGNDTAYQVRITDQLDDNLNIETFKVLSSSHIVRTSLNTSGLVTFDFQEIYLVDSLTNPAGSQGYVSFSIDPLENLNENTSIKNLANIYFDYNPAIVTNEIESVMVSELSTSLKELSSIDANVFPNPIKRGDPLNLKSEIIPKAVNVYHVSGRLVDRFRNESSMKYSTERLTAGSYFLQLISKNDSVVIPFIVIEK